MFEENDLKIREAMEKMERKQAAMSVHILNKITEEKNTLDEVANISGLSVDEIYLLLYKKQPLHFKKFFNLTTSLGMDLSLVKDVD